VQNYRHSSVSCKVGLLFLKILKMCGINLVMVFLMGMDHLTMAILAILTMNFQINSKNIFKIKFIDLFTYLWIDSILNFM
jgi:hypothetical protein